MTVHKFNLTVLNMLIADGVSTASATNIISNDARDIANFRMINE